MYVMRFDWNHIDDLFVETDPTGRAAHGRQHLVIKPLAPAKPTPLQIESYTRYQNQVQPVRWHRHAMPARFANPILAGAQVPRDILNLARDISFRARIKTGQGDRFPRRQ